MTQALGEVVQSTTKLRALYALHPPLRGDSESASNLYRKFLKDLASTRTVPIRGSFTHNGELLAITVRPCTASQKKRHFSKSPFLEIGDAVLEFSATFEFPGQERFFMTDHAGARIARKSEQSIRDWRSFQPHDLELTIQSFFCAVAVAYEGSVRPTQNVWIQDGSEYGTDRTYFSMIHESIEFLRERSAFPEIDIKLDTAINWIFAQNGIFDGYSDTPGSRALNYFTRLFVSTFKNDELSDLIWALAGIEALLVEGGRSSVGQLREKLGALFAGTIDLPWLSTMIGELYKFRSRMIHGDRQIRSFFRGDEKESKKRFEEEYHSQLFAVGMLVLLLRFLISKDLTELRFNTVFQR